MTAPKPLRKNPIFSTNTKNKEYYENSHLVYVIIILNFMGVECMNKKETSIWRDFYGRLKQPGVRRTFRIGYQVVWNLFLLFIVIAILGTAFAGGVGAGYFASLVKDEPIRSKEELSKSIYNYEETSEVYFAGGESLGTLRTDLVREEIPLEEMSDYLKDAIIATEDEYFYEHEGVVPKAILRAMLQEVSNSSVQSGGSTLTQQLIKQQVLTNEVSFSRKAKEILLALRIETFFGKEDILEAYLNVSPFGRNSSGRNIAGAQAAAEGLFGINAKDLTLAQAAYIAGLPQSPFGYTPFTNKGELKENLEPGLNRQKFVLSRMLKAGSITESQYNEAIAYDITKDFSTKKDFAYEKYPALTTEIEKRSIKILAEYLAEQEGISTEEYAKSKDIQNEYATLADEALRQNGYVIRTTINKGMYDGMNKAKNEYKNYGYDKNEDVYNSETKQTESVVEPVETGAMLIENKTGKILSFVGGRDFSREETNHATAPRPTGSTIKPILVYAPAIELGQIAPGSLTLDAPISIPAGRGKAYEPNNYGNNFKGLMTVRKALAGSQNIPAVTTYMGIINQNPLDYLKDMGVTTVMDSDYGLPAVSISGPTVGISVEENTNAFASLANGGKFVDAYMIEKIETKKGEIIYQHEAVTKDVFKPQTAYLTIDMMRDVITSGTAVSLNNRIAFRSDFAGKTGTSNDYHDAWFIASNPNVTLGVWTGYDTPKSLNYQYNGLNYSKRNIYLWADLMNAAYKVDNNLIGTKERFKMPGGLVSKSYCSLLNLPGNVCTAAGIGSDLFPADFAMKLPEGTTTSGRFVTIGGKRYAALASTPAEFVEAGTVFSDEFIKFIGGKYVSSQYLSQYAGIGTTAGVLKDDGRAPLPMTLSLASGTTIAWQTHTDRDVIGYRVYKDNVKVATIKAGTALRYSGSPGTYIVRAVDIAGKESPSSNAVIIQGAPPEPEPPSVPPAASEPPAVETPPAATPEPPADTETETPEPSIPPAN